jgi:hypothetical protein
LRSETLWDVQSGFLAHVRGERACEAIAVPAQSSLDRRMAIYADGQRERIVEALSNDYPAVRRVLGVASFGSLAVRYVERCPSRTHDLGRVGERLGGFLAADPLQEALPFLPDLARLEWALAEAFVAADAVPATWEDFARAGPAAVADRPLRLSPGTALVRSDWPVLEIWRLRERTDAEVNLPVEGRPESVLVHRDGLELRCRRAAPREARLIDAGAQGRCLAALIDDDPAPLLVEAFRGLVSAGLFLPPEDPSTP